MRIPSRQELADYIALTPQERVALNADPRSFLLFFSYYFAEAVKYPFADFHKDFAQDLVDLHDGTITSLVWCTARETAKSAFASGWLLWLILNKRDDYFNVDSYDKANSEGFTFDVSNQLLSNQRIIADYGMVYPHRSTESEKTRSRQGDFTIPANNVRVEAHTTQEPVRGRRHDMHIRPSWVFLDDFETLSTARSEAATRQVSDHISEFATGLDQKNARLLYLCNWITDSGNVAKLKGMSRIDPKCRFREVWRVDEETGLPTWPERDVLTDAELLLPGNEDKVSIESKKRAMRNDETGDADWEREMQGHCVDPMGDGPDKQGFYPLFPMADFAQSIVTAPPVPTGPFALGVDPSGDGDDRTAVGKRTAFYCGVHATESKSDQKSVAAMVVRAMDELNVRAPSVVVDAFGVGFKATQELSLMGHRVKAVNVGELEVCEMEGYANDRAYMYFMLRDFLKQGGKIVEYPELKAQMKSIRFRIDERGKRHILPKKEIKKRGYKSPDELDALAMCWLTQLGIERTRVRCADDEPISRLI